jgi:hypothetical protein
MGSLNAVVNKFLIHLYFLQICITEEIFQVLLNKQMNTLLARYSAICLVSAC